MYLSNLIAYRYHYKNIMKIAIEGCAHGELQQIYNTIDLIEKRDNIKVDLLICCGDFQATRNNEDLLTMAVPPKYRQMCTFHKLALKLN